MWIIFRLAGGLFLWYKKEIKKEYVSSDCCGRCGFSLGEKLHREPWFREVLTIHCTSPEAPVYYRREGWQACPRCRHEWYVVIR